MVNKQELIDGEVLVPILRDELERLNTQTQGRRLMLVDGFPRNLGQRMQFEDLVSILAKPASSDVLYPVLCPNPMERSQRLRWFYSSVVQKRSRSSGILRAKWKGGKQMTR